MSEVGSALRAEEKWRGGEKIENLYSTVLVVDNRGSLIRPSRIGSVARLIQLL